ncbi:MAG: MBL fold metallo-hydrolase [Acidobacteria bacterium]|jgi:glyoxylase-like metal-dependent hydrolase (beta-lactamase superfamily II)|nr:MBL fold metallo-hydrolase [Acidobacteriota bacterium]
MEVEQVKVGQMVVFSYIVSCPETKEALVIDPGGDEKRLAQKIEQKGLILKYIVNTHGHSDHTCGNANLKNLTGAKIIMHEIDDKLFRTPEAISMMRGMGFEPSSPADITVKDGDEIKIGKITMKVLHTPGHTPGGICLLAEGQLFTGDTLFVGGIGRTDLPGSDHRQFMNGIRDKLLTLPDETVVWPGHDYGPRPSSTIGLEKIANPWIRQLIYG